jgi:hypothetical protein
MPRAKVTVLLAREDEANQIAHHESIFGHVDLQQGQKLPEQPLRCTESQ